MLTNTRTAPSISAVDISNDMSAIRRLLIAAAINSRFCASLLADPGCTVQKGFGGEQFHLSETALRLIDSIRAASLSEFVQELNTCFSNHLLSHEYTRAIL